MFPLYFLTLLFCSCDLLHGNKNPNNRRPRGVIALPFGASTPTSPTLMLATNRL